MMDRYSVNGGATTYTRITKSEARKMFNSGDVFYIIAHKMRQGFTFSLGMTIDGCHYARESAENAVYGLPEHTFDKVVRDFCWYSANCGEAGLYAAFYRI